MNGDEENDQPRPPPENGNGQDRDNGNDAAENPAGPENAPEEEGWVTEQLHRLQRYFMNEPIPKRFLDIIRGKKDDDGDTH